MKTVNFDERKEKGNKERMKKKLFTVILSVLLIVSIIPSTAFAANTTTDEDKQSITEVSSAAELEKALNTKKSMIKIVKDFKIDRTFYVIDTARIYTDTKHTLTRADNFTGDIFVVGENSKGESTLENNVEAVLTLGNPESEAKNLLIIDGNKNGMSKNAKVSGSALFICNSAEVNIYDNISIINCQKSGNKRALDSKYHLPYGARVGGAAAIISSGSLNLYGGTFANNITNDESSSDDGDFDKERASSLGGAIFNFANLKMYGGTFRENHAARGGAIYNYRMIKLYDADFSKNTAMKYGGAIYQAESQYGEIIMGGDGKETADGKVIFQENHADSSGGAIFSQTKNAIVIYENAKASFTQNKALKHNGGAISSSGSLTIKKADFTKNDAASKGGAIYLSNSDDELVTRLPNIQNTTFTENTANRGGAVGLMAKDGSYSEGGIATFKNCTFTRNEAINKGTQDQTEEVTDTKVNGGAVYVSRKSVLTAENCTFQENKTEEEGGAVYGTGNSDLTMNKCSFISNTTSSETEGNGGAVSVHGSKLNIKNSKFIKNNSKRHAGALYISYNKLEDGSKASKVTVTDSKFTENESAYHGGAIYVTSPEDDSSITYLKLSGSTLDQNRAANNGGAIYFTKSKAYLNDNDFLKNEASSDKYGGGAIYSTSSDIDINSVRLKQNHSAYNGGGIAMYSNSKFSINRMTASGNETATQGAVIYTNKSEMNLYNSSFEGNNSQSGGGAISCYTDAKSNIYHTTFDSNTSKNNGGALYIYTGETGSTLVQDSKFIKNNAAKYGGAIYASKASPAYLYMNTAKENSAEQGGMLYETTENTNLTLNGLTISGNTAAKGGAIIYGNTKKAILNIDQSRYKDEDMEVNENYWRDEIEANANKLTIRYISEDIPDAADYVHEDFETTDDDKNVVSVNDIFDLAKESSNKSINSTYGKLPKLSSKSNFMSRSTTKFNNINGKNVTVDSFVYHPNKPENNPNVGEGLLIYQAMAYKKAHPEKEVSIDISSFRFSAQTAVCINRNSRYFGYMRSLVGQDYDEYGFVRISYLLVSAAKMGIHVNVIAQLDGYPIDKSDPDLNTYFTSQLKRSCDPDYAKGKKIQDFLDFHYCYWTSYGNDAATDMMHTKACAVSDYVDKDGKEHHNALWLSSSNLDGMNANGTNGNNGVQTGVIISDHEKLYQVGHNYLQLIGKYCGQEDVYEFRELVNQTMTKQIRLIKEGKESSINPQDQIVYLGSENDHVFELYFAPFGGNAAKWDNTNNPFCKYLQELNDSDGYIWFSWSNVKFLKTFPLCSSMESKITQAFHKNKNKKNRIYILLPGNETIPGFDGSKFNDLKVGKDIQYKSFNKKAFGTVHNKDIQMSYSKNGKRSYVTLLNSMNIHQGSMSYQSNFALVIKETNAAKGSIFHTIAKNTTEGIVSANIAKLSVKLSKSSFTYDGKVKKPTVSIPGAGSGDYKVSYASGRKNVGKYKVTVTGKGSYYTGSKTLYFTIKPARVSFKSITAKKKAITVKWKQPSKTKLKQTTGYQIQYSTSSKFKSGNKTATISKNKITAKTIKKLNAKKKYYVRIRTYKTVKGVKYYSTWSKTKSVKTKK